MNRSRRLLGAALAALGGSASVVLFACSTSIQMSTGPDASDTADGAAPDVTVGEQPDTSSSSQPDTSPPPGLDAADAAVPLVGNCEPVQGPACDLVLQNCPNGSGGVPQECLVVSLDDGGSTTGCSAVASSEHLGTGHGCCPSASDKQCDPGLECIGDPTLSCDGGIPAGRCSPHCCGDLIDGGDDFLCGQADPEGYQGHCDTQVVDQNGNPLFNACTYLQVCVPFGIKPCPADYTCQVQDVTGLAGCDNIYTTGDGAPPAENQPCVASNNCADGLTCLTLPDGGGSCFMECLTPGAIPPFDAGALDGGPFSGGCPTGEACNTSVEGFPSWLSFCAP